jgi:hypothetical protein
MRRILRNNVRLAIEKIHNRTATRFYVSGKNSQLYEQLKLNKDDHYFFY